MKYFGLFVLLFFSTFKSPAQKNDYPKDYFRNPLDIPIILAGNYGECRPNHFHTGIDIKTNGKENLPVHAAADGYVYRVNISHLGYGNCLYVKHPNGYVTVYAHLNRFTKAIESYVQQQQYADKSWAINIMVPAGKFPVKKGQVIAYSGNTGGSTAPHLHFEIRDAQTEHVLNAGLFGLPIHDNIAPIPKKLAIYTSESVYDQDPKLYNLVKSGNGYSIQNGLIITSSPEVRFALFANDYMPSSHNTLGVYSMQLFVDDSLQLSWQLNDLDFSKNRDVNAFADYPLKAETDDWYESLYRLPGNHLDIYKKINATNGLINIGDEQPHNIKIKLFDFSGNVTSVSFKIKYDGSKVVESNKYCNEWKPDEIKYFSNDLFKFEAPKGSVYDKVCITYSTDTSNNKLSAELQLLNTNIPLAKRCKLSMKLLQFISFKDRSKLAFVHHIKAAKLPGNNPQSGMAATFENGWASADIYTLGNFYIVIDTVPPTIMCNIKDNTNLSKTNKITFTVKESITSVDDVVPTINGHWIRFVRRGDTYTYYFDEHCPKGKNTLVIKAKDENDNVATQTITFIR